MSANSDPDMQDAVVTVCQLTTEEKIRQKREAQEDYYRRTVGRERLLRETLAENERLTAEIEQAIAKRNQIIAERNQAIAEIEQVISEIEQAISEKELTVSEKKQIASKYKKLQQRISELGIDIGKAND